MRTNLRNRGLGLVVLLSLTTMAFSQIGGGGGQAGAPPDGPQRGFRGQGGAPPVRIVSGKVGDWVAAGQARYRVVTVTSGLRSYKQAFNQAGKKLHPGFAADRLAVIVVEIENFANRPIEPPIFAAALTDSDGARGTDWLLDARQQAFLEESVRGGRAMSRVPAEIGPRQVMKVALVFSVSPKALPTLLEFSPENFRDMAFGAPGRFQPGMGGGNAPRGQFGQRPPADGAPPRPGIRVSIDLRQGK